MPSSEKTPQDLAKTIYDAISNSPDRPNQETLDAIFKAMFASSLKTEEGQPIKFSISYLSPKEPVPATPPMEFERPIRNTWTRIPFATAIPFNTRNAVKLAKATDPRTSSFAVFHTKSGLPIIWGLIDQNNPHYQFMNYDAPGGAPRPGIFQAEIRGLGHIFSSKDYDVIAELRINSITRSQPDVINVGPISVALQTALNGLANELKPLLPAAKIEPASTWTDLVRTNAKETLCRILSRIRDHRHGGALIITPDKKLTSLDPKFRIKYPRLRTSLLSAATSEATLAESSFEIRDEYLEKDVGHIPEPLYLDESISKFELADSKSEIDGVVWFLSLLSRVDGAVVLTTDLTVQGFGTEITCHQNPPKLFRTSDALARPDRLSAFRLEDYGTRHRSMMRYCYSTPGSIGFVISQDGDVRAIMRTQGKLVMWENIKLQRTRKARTK
ncbi:putative sensor domain DACNV-containing protein [Corallococcus sp. AS-1-12]|uniref:putative sensor domain DACNV-containing protein n=1 Tax=Corallococcus sp. AS-1-12 TaxID=2874598 RepID=UPI001CC09B30|nr:hypothetical protein [Corallococcus sp. AS-1-12]MBZ4336660.1 hypothetical protein [Corallococcus sp. AS-1-12]